MLNCLDLNVHGQNNPFSEFQDNLSKSTRQRHWSHLCSFNHLEGF